MALRLQGLCLRRPQTVGSHAVGRKGWFGEEDVITPFCICLSAPDYVPFHCASAHSLHFLLGFVMNLKQELEFIFHLQSGIHRHTGPWGHGTYVALCTVCLQHLWYASIFICFFQHISCYDNMFTVSAWESAWGENLFPPTPIYPQNEKFLTTPPPFHASASLSHYLPLPLGRGVTCLIGESLAVIWLFFSVVQGSYVNNHRTEETTWPYLSLFSFASLGSLGWGRMGHPCSSALLCSKQIRKELPLMDPDRSLFQHFHQWLDE